MGCIVNGPGEMADADFGYVGGAPGKIDLYVGKVYSHFQLNLNWSGVEIFGLFYAVCAAKGINRGTPCAF